MPTRKFDTVNDLESCMKDKEELIFDGTEIAIERSKDYATQKENYSGKKGTHTNVVLTLSDRTRWLYYVSLIYAGCEVDFGIFKAEFPPDQAWFKQKRVIVDLGFIGIEAVYEAKEIQIGFKRKRGKKGEKSVPLSEEQKAHNKAVSRQRIYIEHAIGRLKVFRILKNRMRAKSLDWKNKIIGICAGLANYKLSVKC